VSGSIELARVSFRYLSSGPLVLDNVTLKIAPGEYLELRSLVAAPTCSSLLGPDCTAFSMRRAGTERYASDPEYRASIPQISASPIFAARLSILHSGEA
jgi:hypothetical protein